MNKKIFFVIILLLLISYIVSGDFLNNKKNNSEILNDQWIIQPIEFTGDGSHYIDSSIGSDDTLYISYFDRSLNVLKVAFINGESTNIEIVDSNGIVGQYSSIITDSNNCLHVSYYDLTNKVLKYAYYNNIEWKIEIVDSSADIGMYTCIDVDSMNNPHISYYDKSNGNLKYCYWNGYQWIIDVVIDDGDIGIGSSLIIDTNDVPHISFTDENSKILFCANKIDSDWEVSVVDNECTVFASTSIDVDNSNFAHISYFDVGTSEEDWNLKHAYYDGSNWINEIVDPDLKYFWNDWGVSIAVDRFNRIHIGYYCWYKWDLKYAYKINNIWNIETVESDGDVGIYASIVINSNNYPLISYMSRSSVELKYAKKIQYSPDTPEKPKGPNKGKPNEIYTFEAIGFDFDKDFIKYYWDWGDGSDFEITDYSESGENILINHTWTKQGSYNIKVKAVDINGYESSWSEPLKITISKTKYHFFFLKNIIKLFNF